MNLEMMKAGITDSVLYSMYDYIMEDDEDEYADEEFAPYTKEDVDECGKILEDYLDRLAEAGNGEQILQCVKKTVEELNALNERLDFSLIETEQREDLCCFIMDAASLAGLDAEEDITEEWREW